MAKRQSVTPTQSNTMLNYLNPPKAKKPKKEGEASRADDPEEPEEEEFESPLNPAKGRLPPLGITVTIHHPRPGPSNAPDGANKDTEETIPIQVYRTFPTVDTDESSECSSYTRGLELGPVGSVEEMDVDDPNLMTVDSSSSIERDSTYRLDWTGSRM